MVSNKLEECAFYVETYLPCRNLVSFYADRGEMKRALEVFTDTSNLITAEDFNKNLFKVAVQLDKKENEENSRVEELLTYISGSDSDRSFWRKFLLPVASNFDAYKPKIMVHLYLVLEVGFVFFKTRFLYLVLCQTKIHYHVAFSSRKSGYLIYRH